MEFHYCYYVNNGWLCEPQEGTDEDIEDRGIRRYQARQQTTLYYFMQYKSFYPSLCQIIALQSTSSALIYFCTELSV